MKTLLNKHRFLLSLVAYELVISARIFAEMGLCSIHTYIHQLVWFNTVLLIFVLSFNKILKIELEKLWLLSAGAFLTFIPLIYSALSGHDWALNYIEPASFSQVTKDLLTLLCCHEYNWPMFPELLLLLTGSFAMAFYLSKDLKRSSLSSLAAFFGSFLLLGFSWIAVNPDHPTLFIIKSSLSDSKFYSLQLITIFITLLSVTNFSLLQKFFRNFSQPSFHISNFIAIAGFYSVLIYLTDKPLTLADNIVTFTPILFIAETVRRFSKKIDATYFTMIWISILSAVALLMNSRL